jgi:hypothetical protein
MAGWPATLAAPAYRLRITEGRVAATLSAIQEGKG